MAKTARSLDTPFRPGERVIAATDTADITTGTKGKVQLANGLGHYRRYWVRFDGGRVRGQVPHEVLVRPGQIEDWIRAQEAKAQAALNKGKAAAAAVEAASSPDASGGSTAAGVAGRIPATLLDRSKAAKARLLGG